MVLSGIAGLLAGAGLAMAFRPKVLRAHQLLIRSQEAVARGDCVCAAQSIKQVEKTMFQMKAEKPGQENTMGVLLSAYEGTRRDMDKRCARPIGALGGFVTKQGPRRFCVHNEPTKKIIVAKGKQRCHPTRREANNVWYRLDCQYTGRHCEKVRT